MRVRVPPGHKTTTVHYFHTKGATTIASQAPVAKALALATRLNFHVFPVREQPGEVNGRILPTKSPYTFSGFKEATTDPQQIRRWWERWPNALVGVAAGASFVVVGDIDMGADDASGEVKDGWFSLQEAELDDLPETFCYQTRSGGEHHIYAAPEGVPLGPTQNHVTPDGVKLDAVDRRAGASYFIWWSDEVPESRDVFAQAPDWLLTPARVQEAGEQFSGSVKEWMDKCVQGEPPQHLRDYLADLAERQGHIDHGDLIDFQRYLVGEAADKLTPGVPQIISEFRALYTDFPDEGGKSWEREFDIALQGAITKYGTFALGPRDIPLVDHVPLMGRMGGVDSAFLPELMMALPADTTPEGLRTRVALIMSRALSEGLEVIEAAALGWWSAASQAAGGIRQSQPQDAALTDLWNLAWQVAAKPVTTEAPAPAPAPLPELPAAESAVSLLTVRERSGLTQWWGDEFMDVMGQIHPVMAEQFYRLNRWMILSLIFADKAIIQWEGGARLVLNFYGANIGPSKIGKSESPDVVTEIVDMYFLNADSPDIGGDATVAALTQALIRRDGQTSFFHADEADSVIRNWKDDRGEFRGMPQRITDIWGGKVPTLQRATLKDLSGIHAKAYLCVHLTGIHEKLVDAIAPSDWETGFLNRFIFAIGKRKPRTREQRRLRVRRNGGEGPGKSTTLRWYSQWVALFQQIANTTLVASTGGPIEMDIADDVLDRHMDTEEAFERIAARYPRYEARLDATFGRLDKTVLKCAALVAITRKRRRVEMEDYLIALEQAEEWAQNIITLVHATDESPRSREVKRLAAVIRNAGGRMEMAAINRLEVYAGDSVGTGKLVDELIAQGLAERLEVDRTNPAATIIRLKEEV